MNRANAEQQLYPELQPLLTLQIPDDWERVPVHDGHIVYGVRFYYRSVRRDAVDISYWDWSYHGVKLQTKPKYQTWFLRCTDKQYGTLEEAIKRMVYLMPIVERQSHWEDIANVRSEEYRCKLHERKGIGGETLMALLDRFITLDGLHEATIEDIETTSGIGPDKAWLISDHLHSNIRYHELWDPNKGEWVDLYCVPREVINQCARTHTYMTQEIRNKYRLSRHEIKERGLVKVRAVEGGEQICIG